MQLTPEIREDILYEYKRTRSPFKVSRAVGVPVTLVWEVIEDSSDRLYEIQERWGGQGRPELADFVVARRKAAERGWDNDDPAIAKARADFEEGTIEMVTGRDGQWLILYAIPRKVKRPRPNYFAPEFSI